MRSRFYNQIKNALEEREVEDVYNLGLTMYFPGVGIQNIKHQFECDGLLETSVDGTTVKLLIEYKFDEDLKNRVTTAKILVQVLYYIKRFEFNGLILPNVIMVADKNECFVMHTNALVPYLDEELDWNIAPSKAYHSCPELIKKIAEDMNISYFVYNVDETFSFKDVADKIKELAKGIVRYIHISEHNLSTIYNYFVNEIIRERKKIRDNDIVAIFIGVLNDRDRFYLHPNNPNKLVTPFGDVQINGSVYHSFFQHFDREYTPKEKKRFTAIADRLMEDNNRRAKGEFYTPTLFVDYAHKMIAEQFGDDWREKYVVWDNCAGSKNLTRDYYFKELYSSTLEKAELEISKKYNKEGTSFQFDFLNDDSDKIPEGLMTAFRQDKPIIVFINPPYARNSGKGETTMGTSDACCYTKVRESMMKGHMDACTANLYAQFLYRCTRIKVRYALTNFNICFFSPTLYLSGKSWANFRKYFFDSFEYKSGCTFKASYFADVAENWGIAFSIWASGQTVHVTDFRHQVIDVEEGSIKQLGLKDVYNLDQAESASDWIRDGLPKLKKYDAPNLTSGISIKEKNGARKCMWADGALGYFASKSNNIDKNTQSIALFSYAYSDNVGTLMFKENFLKCTALFTARRIIACNWKNWADEYLKPDITHPKYAEFENDSLVYSLFESKSNQSALYNIEHSGKNWNIKNEFFWLSKNEMADLAERYNNDDCYNCASTSDERYVYTLLRGITLSEEAQEVLDIANDLVRKSFQYRLLFDNEHPEYQINNWDCGYYQLKSLWKEYFPEDFESLRTGMNKLKDKLTPMVYEVGFLK